MSDNRKYAQLQAFTLNGAGTSIADVTVVLTSFNDIDGNSLSMSSFGTKAYGTLEPGSSSQEEQISFTGITQNTNGTATLTGVSNVGFLFPYTEISGLLKSHSGGVRFVITNTSGFYDGFTNKQDDETIAGLWQFPSNSNTPVIGSSYVAPTIDNQIASKKYVDDVAVSGAPDANETTKGIVQIATNAQMGTHTSLGSTGARLIPPNDQLVQTSSGAGDANKLPTLGGSGTLASGFLPVVPITKGGTGQATQTLGFDALSPTTTKGDIIADNGTDAIRVPVGTNTYVIIADSAQTSGLKWGPLSQAGGEMSLVVGSTPVTVNTTSAETTVVTYSVPGGTFGTTHALKGRIWFTDIGENGDVNKTCTIRVKYGGTQLGGSVFKPSVGGAAGMGYTDFQVFAVGSTSVQRGYVDVVMNDQNLGSPIPDYLHFSTGTSSIDSTTAHDLVVTVQNSGSDAADTITMRNYYIELV